MVRRNFSEILRNASIDIRREYERLYGLFYQQRIINQNGIGYCLRDYCAMNFINLPFRGTCISLDDFDDYHELYIERKPPEIDVDYLISFCEYSYNLVLHLQPTTPILTFDTTTVIPTHNIISQLSLICQKTS